MLQNDDGEHNYMAPGPDTNSPAPMSFWRMVNAITNDVLASPIINTGTWQALDISRSPAHRTYELLDAWVDYPVFAEVQQLIDDIHPDLPWAEDHFLERIGGNPLNPAPSHEWWPYAKGGNRQHMAANQFDHTYPERYWPRKAGDPPETMMRGANFGIRFRYGDLDDLVNLLVEQPFTRQAYLPVWFPEDTGAIREGKNIRVPCSLGYHFLIRNGELSCRYYLRSCDLYRHFHNDIYMTARLMQWICSEVELRSQTADVEVPLPMLLKPGKLITMISSLHLFVNDADKMKERIEHELL